MRKGDQNGEGVIRHGPPRAAVWTSQSINPPGGRHRDFSSSGVDKLRRPLASLIFLQCDRPLLHPLRERLKQ
jgi:hypothetical protein